MGYELIGKGVIELPKDTSDEIVKAIEKQLMDVPHFTNVKVWEDKSMSFEMDGHNAINYKPLDDLVQFILAKGVKDFEVYCNEWIENNDGGFYFTEGAN